MRIGSVAIACCGLALVAAPAFADAPKVANQVSGAQDDTKVVCRREKNLGSLLPGPKVCMTVRDWRASAAGAREYADRLQRERRLNSSGPGGN